MTNAVGQPGGTVSFYDGSTLLGTAQLGASGVATITVASFSAGGHAIVANYSGDAADFPSISSALAETVQLRPTTTTMTSSLTGTGTTQQVTLITVVHYSGPTAATGTVTFNSGSKVLGTTQIDSTGVATLNLTLDASSSITASATYSGDMSYAGSASADMQVSGGTAVPYTLTLNPSAVTLQSKQHSTVALTITSLKSFADTLKLGCLGLPYATTCTFTTTQTALAANGTVNVQLTVDTGDPLGSSATAGLGAGASVHTLLFTLPITLLLSFWLWASGNRRKLPALFVMAFAVALTVAATGCAGLSTNGTPAGTYTFYVTASGQNTGATQSQAVTLTVTP